MKAYEMNPKPREVFGEGTSLDAGKRMKAYGVSKVVVVTDKTLMDLGIATPIVDAVKAEGLEVTMYTDVSPEPPAEQCVACGELIKEVGAQGVIGIGGGSVMDLAKVAALSTGIDEKITDLYEYSTEGTKMKPSIERKVKLILIPTTSGTGAEATLGCVITDPGRRLKMVLFNEDFLPDLCIIDSKLTIGMPAYVTATCGMDIMAHSIEHLIGIGQLEFMDDVLFDCVARTWKWLPLAIKEPENAEARSQLAWASHNALCNGGFSNSHALAQAMGGLYFDKHLVHGHICGITLPVSVRWHAETRAIQIRKLADIFALPVGDEDDAVTIADRVANAIYEFHCSLGLTDLQGLLKEKGVTDDRATFIDKMMPNVKVESLANKFDPPIHEDDKEMRRILERLWDNN